MNEEPPDPVGYRQIVADNLRWMRDRMARKTQSEMARALRAELRRSVPDTSISRWETGGKLAGADVFVAYMRIAGVPLPQESRKTNSHDEPSEWMRKFEHRFDELERRFVPPGRSGKPIALDDLATVTVAAQRRGVARQSVHNWIAKEEIRFVQQGRRLLVSLSDVLNHP